MSALELAHTDGNGTHSANGRIAANACLDPIGHLASVVSGDERAIGRGARISSP